MKLFSQLNDIKLKMQHPFLEKLMNNWYYNLNFVKERINYIFRNLL